MPDDIVTLSAEEYQALLAEREALRGELRLAKAERDLAEERLRAYKHELFGASSEARASHDGRASADRRTVKSAGQGAAIHARSVAQTGPLCRERKLAYMQQLVRKRHQAIRRWKEGMAVRRHRCWCAGQRQSLLARRDLQGERHRSIPLSRLAVREVAARHNC